MSATGYSPLWGVSYSPLRDYSPNNRQLFRFGRLNRKVRELLDTTIGAAAGSAASLSVKQVAQFPQNFLGVATLQDRSIISRNTTADDVTELKNYFSEDSKIATPSNGAGTNWEV